MDFSSFKKMYSWGVPESSRVRCDLGRVVASKAGRLDQGLSRSLQPQTPGHCAGRGQGSLPTPHPPRGPGPSRTPPSACLRLCGVQDRERVGGVHHGGGQPRLGHVAFSGLQGEESGRRRAEWAGAQKGIQRESDRNNHILTHQPVDSFVMKNTRKPLI